MSRVCENLRTLEKLAQLFNDHDLDGIMELFADDCDIAGNDLGICSTIQRPWKNAEEESGWSRSASSFPEKNHHHCLPIRNASNENIQHGGIGRAGDHEQAAKSVERALREGPARSLRALPNRRSAALASTRDQLCTNELRRYSCSYPP